MSAAVFFLVVNFVIAICFSAVFALVSVYSRWRTAALSFSIGLGITSFTMVCEFGVAYSQNPRPWAMAVYGTVLAGMVFLRAGIAILYGRPLPLWSSLATFLAGMAIYIVIQDIPRDSWRYSFFYQGSYAFVSFAAAGSVLASQRRTAIDRTLAVVLLVSGLHFFVKALLAEIIGSGSTQSDYVFTHYAVVSQSITAVMIVAVGLILLAVLTLDIMAEERGRAERDSLSGLANRRGFEKGVNARMLGRNDIRHSLILCDLDHFKSINDTFGHHAGDMVIQAFGTLLSEHVNRNAVIGRIGGEEFAVFLPDTLPSQAVELAEALRAGVKSMNVSGMPPTFSVTASFGVSSLLSGENLEDAMRQADEALYEAKRSTRDCVREWFPSRTVTGEEPHGPKSSAYKVSSQPNLDGEIRAETSKRRNFNR